MYRVIEQLASWVDASMSSTSFSLSPSKATRKERITVWWLKTQTRSPSSWAIDSWMRNWRTRCSTSHQLSPDGGR